MKPMLQFTSLLQRAEERPRRRRRAVKTPQNPKVRGVALFGAVNLPTDDDNCVNSDLITRGAKWVSPQFDDLQQEKFYRRGRRQCALKLREQLFLEERQPLKNCRKEKLQVLLGREPLKEKECNIENRRKWSGHQMQGWGRHGLTDSQDISLYPSYYPSNVELEEKNCTSTALHQCTQIKKSSKVNERLLKCKRKYSSTQEDKLPRSDPDSSHSCSLHNPNYSTDDTMSSDSKDYFCKWNSVEPVTDGTTTFPKDQESNSSDVQLNDLSDLISSICVDECCDPMDSDPTHLSPYEAPSISPLSLTANRCGWSQQNTQPPTHLGVTIGCDRLIETKEVSKDENLQVSTDERELGDHSERKHVNSQTFRPPSSSTPFQGSVRQHTLVSHDYSTHLSLAKNLFYDSTRLSSYTELQPPFIPTGIVTPPCNRSIGTQQGGVSTRGSEVKSILKRRCGSHSCCLRNRVIPSARKRLSKSVTFNLPFDSVSESHSTSVLAKETPEHMWTTISFQQDGLWPGGIQESSCDSKRGDSGKVKFVGVEDIPMNELTECSEHVSCILDATISQEWCTDSSLDYNSNSFLDQQQISSTAQSEDLSVLAMETPTNMWLSPPINLIDNTLL